MELSTSLETNPAVGNKVEDLLSALQQALGFRTGDINQEQVCQPYIDYIQTSRTGRGERQDFLRFLVEVMRHFRGTILS